jgi:hypothetical protein
VPTVVIRAKQGHTIAVTGPVNLTSIHDQPSAAVITFGDGTVLDVDLAGRVIVNKAGYAEVFIAHDPDGDRVTVIGLPLRHICVNHGGNHQECPI